MARAVEVAGARHHAGLSPARIVDAALDLTAESHLFGWSIRDLARRLEVAPSVIYHHVGGKDLIARHVVERTLEDLTAPEHELGWQPWFRSLLETIYPIVVARPGVAKWVLMHGPVFPTVLPLMDTGIALLRQAGFADTASMAYAALLNNAMLTVSMGDERLLHEEDGARDHATMMAEFRRAAQGSAGAAHLAETFMTPFAAGGEAAARQRAEYYRFITETTIAGLEAVLAAGPPGDPRGA